MSETGSTWTQLGNTLNPGQSLIPTKFWAYAKSSTPISKLFIHNEPLISSTQELVRVEAKLYSGDSSTMIQPSNSIPVSTPLDSFLMESSKILPYILDTSMVNFDSLHTFTQTNQSLVSS